MLGDAAGFLADDIGGADGVEQGRLAVIDMAHDGHHRSARLQVLFAVLLADEAFLHIGLRDAANAMAELLGDQLGGVGVDHVRNLAHLAVPHEELDDIDAALGHAVGELLDGDHFGHHHVALDLLLRQGTGDLFLLPLAVTLQRGEAALALLLVERVGDGEPAAHSLIARTRLDGTLLLVVACFRGAGGLFLLLLGKLLARGLLALAACLGLGLVPHFLFLLPLGGFVALFRPLLVGDDAEFGIDLGLLALNGFALARVVQRAEPCVFLVVGERAQHHARAARLYLPGNSALRRRLGDTLCRLGRRLLDHLRCAARADSPPLLLLDQDGLGAPMAEALAHMAGLDRAPQTERHLAAAGDGLAFRLVCLTHP